MHLKLKFVSTLKLIKQDAWNFKAALSVTFDLLFFEVKILFFKNTVKILKFT